ncbi:MAG: YeeE/YedE thiosulfate transporter family protein, partial [Thioalkalispiraceae bacterium]
LAGNGNHTGWIAVFFFAIFASLTQFGLLEPIRVYSLMHTSVTITKADAGLATLLSAPKWLILAIIDVLLIGFIVTKWKKHADIKLIIAGIILGLTVSAAWYTTGVLAIDEFAPATHPSAMTVSGPMSRTGIMLVAGQYPALSFSVSFVIALFLISFIVAVITRQFKLTPVKGSVGKVALGGALMGIGATFSYGCNIGQGYSGLSTLSLESILAVIAMVAGIHFTTRYLEKNA